MNCLDHTLTDITVGGGELQLTFADGMVLTAEADDRYESWQINSEDGLLVVCTPGGDLTIWYPPEN